MAKKASRSSKSVETVKHKDKRANIPTEELRDFVADEESKPKTILYPRDTSLDPQLVWKGKDEQDTKPLAVPAVPIYIQEKIKPRAIIDDLHRVSRSEASPQAELFSDFNGLEFEKMIDFYHHESNWTNRMVLGDSLMVMNSMAEKEGLKGKVQMIYIDPPYGIRFGSNWQVSTKKREVKDGKAEDSTRQPEQIRAFRDTWKIGIHSYLSYLRDRLVMAHELLSESGSVFVQIGDENVHLARCLMDEVFGSENFVGLLIVQKTSAPTDKYVPTVSDFILWYGKEVANTKYRQIYLAKWIGGDGGSQYTWVELPSGTERKLSKEEKENPSRIPSGSKIFAASDASSSHEYSLGKEPIEFKGLLFLPGGRYWSTSPDGMIRLKWANRFVISGNTLFYKRLLDDFPVFPLSNIWTDTSSSFGERTYVVQTTTKVIERCLLMSTDPGDIVLDPTCLRKGTRVWLWGNTPFGSPVNGGMITYDSSLGGGENCARNQGLRHNEHSGLIFPADGPASSPSPFTGRVGVGHLVPIEDIRPGDMVFSHDGKPHKVLRITRRRFKGAMIGICHKLSDEILWMTDDHKILIKNRKYVFTGKRDWSHTPRESFAKARALRHSLTEPEQAFWRAIRSRQLRAKFRKQHPIGPYIVDFFCPERSLVVEIDGNSHFSPDGLTYDQARTEYLNAAGLAVVRYTNKDISENLDGVLQSLSAIVGEEAADFHEKALWIPAGELRTGDIVYFGMELHHAGITEIFREETVEDVYDLEVENAHSFLTELCAVHNCGSGTTAYVAEQWGRRWITIDTSRVALALARTRLMAARYSYYILADSPEGLSKEAEITGKTPPDYKTDNNIKKGFVWKRVPHITLKSIAHNPEIDAIHDKWHEKLEPVQRQLNSEAKKKWEEWEIPREPGDKWSAKAKQLLEQWWSLRNERQKEIDDSITGNADFELLYDQPYIDNRKIRVSGSFTVESLSPHRVISTELEIPGSSKEGQEESAARKFETMILENLKSAGVQNTYKNERLKFDRLESYAGIFIHGEGEYTESGKSRRVAVSIGPEYGTVGPDLIKDAAKEAVQGIGFDMLIVCGFAFDPHVNEEAKRYGKLIVLPARMNPDLAMGDELLKKTGSGNLFMVFGEPDIAITKSENGQIIVEIKGLDVYDPTTGEVRNNSTDDIACWFIDTDYNGESFFVRHAYFTGADQPYDKLKRALKAEIDEEAWQSLYSTISRPFPIPKTGKIAVKVINHYGDEVLKVYDI